MNTMQTNSQITELPAIPAKRYFTIGEVSELCRVKPSRIAALGAGIHSAEARQAPGNRRYYQHHEVLLIRKIRIALRRRVHHYGCTPSLGIWRRRTWGRARSMRTNRLARITPGSSESTAGHTRRLSCVVPLLQKIVQQGFAKRQNIGKYAPLFGA